MVSLVKQFLLHVIGDVKRTGGHILVVSVVESHGSSICRRRIASKKYVAILVYGKVLKTSKLQLASKEHFLLSEHLLAQIPVLLSARKNNVPTVHSSPLHPLS